MNLKGQSARAAQAGRQLLARLPFHRNTRPGNGRLFNLASIIQDIVLALS
jgi:hypothetical protein